MKFEKFHTCEFCGQIFDNFNKLSQHKKKKHGIKCPLCEGVLFSKEGLTSHLRQKHNSCPECSKVFSNNQNLELHLINDHNICFICQVCDKKFLTVNRLKIHLFDEHSKYFCHECGIVLSTEKELITHKKNFHKSTYSCRYCNEKFDSFSKYEKYDEEKCKQKLIDTLVCSKNKINKESTIPMIEVNSKGQKLRVIDVHDFYKNEATDILIKIVKDCLNKNINLIKIIHGYKHSNVLQKYFRSKEFMNKMESLNFLITVKDKSDPGITILQLKSRN